MFRIYESQRYKYPVVPDILASKSLFPSRSEGVKSKLWLICDTLTWLGTLSWSDLWGALPSLPDYSHLYTTHQAKGAQWGTTTTTSYIPLQPSG